MADASPFTIIGGLFLVLIVAYLVVRLASAAYFKSKHNFLERIARNASSKKKDPL